MTPTLSIDPSQIRQPADFRQVPTDLVSIRRFLTPDESYDGEARWQVVTSVPGRLAPTGPVWMLTLPPLTDVTVKDQVTNGRETFEVVGVLGPWSRDLPRRAVCRRI